MIKIVLLQTKTMKKNILICSFLLLLTISLFSQEEIIKNVQETQEMIEMDAYRYHEVVFQSNLAAIGLQETKIRFYYTDWQRIPEEDPYLMDAKLIKIEIRYNIAASAEIYQEYIFDDNGILMYYYLKETGAVGYYNNATISLYIKNNKLLSFEKEELNEGGETVNDFKKSTFNKEEKALFESVSKKAEQYYAYFQEIRKLEQLK